MELTWPGLGNGWALALAVLWNTLSLLFASVPASDSLEGLTLLLQTKQAGSDCSLTERRRTCFNHPLCGSCVTV